MFSLWKLDSVVEKLTKWHPLFFFFFFWLFVWSTLLRSNERRIGGNDAAFYRLRGEIGARFLLFTMTSSEIIVVVEPPGALEPKMQTRPERKKNSKKLKNERFQRDERVRPEKGAPPRTPFLGRRLRNGLGPFRGQQQQQQRQDLHSLQQQRRTETANKQQKRPVKSRKAHLRGNKISPYRETQRESLTLSPHRYQNQY